MWKYTPGMDPDVEGDVANGNAGVATCSQPHGGLLGACRAEVPRPSIALAHGEVLLDVMLHIRVGHHGGTSAPA
jgi:hypothetical protein